MIRLTLKRDDKGSGSECLLDMYLDKLDLSRPEDRLLLIECIHQTIKQEQSAVSMLDYFCALPKGALIFRKGAR